MNLAGLHVVAACIALTVGMTVLARRKGGWSHVALGRLYLAAMLVVNLPVLFLYEATGRPGPFHVLAVLSLMTTAVGWLSLRRRRPGGQAIRAHASLMTWSWIGVTTAGLAQFANHQWPHQSPWPVLSVVVFATAIGLVSVPRYVSRQLRLRSHHRAAPSSSNPDGPTVFR